MSPQQRRRKRGGSGSRRNAPASREFWGVEGADVVVEAPEPITPADDPTAMIRSLGRPPLPGHETAAEHYFDVMYEKATSVAIALAAASGLLAPNDDED
jgi:hypothetical protein